ncbi:MAG: hypothetical protein EOP85_14370 [Verrucomicrobiaceae bacterium]|nr:MAG: hypothetical protein EOP85_14370 [Verrucomicrobiaceae bacterium]
MSSDPSFLNEIPGKKYVHVLTGPGEGFVTDIDQIGASTITCADDVTQWIQPGNQTQIRIRCHPSISDLLGADNRFALGSGEDAGSADNLVVWDPELQNERVYYFHSSRLRWEEKDIEADAGAAILRFPHGFYIVRRSTGTLRIALSGEIGSDAVLLPVRTGANVFSLPVNLSASLYQIVRAEGMFPVLSGSNAMSADILTFEEPTTGAQRGPFYQMAREGESGWREVGFDDSTAPSQPLDFLSTLVIRREGTAGYVFAKGSLEPPLVPIVPLPPDPEADEVPLFAEIPLRQAIPSGVTLTVETSTDLQTWSTHTTPELLPGKVTFQLPSGQGRAFYRLKVSYTPWIIR